MSHYKKVAKQDDVKLLAKLIIECVRNEHIRALAWFRRSRKYSRYVHVNW